MNTFLRPLFFGLVMTASLAVMPSPAARSDDYWNGYWGWYDTTYQPYYTRRYYSGPAYTYYGAAPGYTYYGPGYNYYGPGYYYGPGTYGYYAPYGRYYGAPRAGVMVYPGGGAAARVGPVRFGWR